MNRERTRHRKAAFLASKSCAARAGILTFAMLLVFAACAAVAFCLDGASGVLAAAAAVACCLFAGMLALFLGNFLRGPELAVANLLCGIMLRMGIPLAFIIVIYVRGGMLVDAGMVFYLLIAYFVMLAVETGLMLTQVSASADSLKA